MNSFGNPMKGMDHFPWWNAHKHLGIKFCMPFMLLLWKFTSNMQAIKPSSCHKYKSQPCFIIQKKENINCICKIKNQVIMFKSKSQCCCLAWQQCCICGVAPDMVCLHHVWILSWLWISIQLGRGAKNLASKEKNPLALFTSWGCHKLGSLEFRTKDD